MLISSFCSNNYLEDCSVIYKKAYFWGCKSYVLSCNFIILLHGSQYDLYNFYFLKFVAFFFKVWDIIKFVNILWLI